jgi:hypothetical protein
MSEVTRDVSGSKFTPWRQPAIRAGVYLYGIASAAAGILDLVWREFEPAHQPIQALSDHIPGVKILACITAVFLIAAGTALLWQRTARFGAALLVIIYFMFAVFLFPRFYTAPHYLGYHAAVFIGILAAVGQQLILVAAGVILYASHGLTRPPPPGVAIFARWTFALCSIDFGLAHLTAVHSVTPLVPSWLPLSGNFWTIFTGIAFILAGLAILFRILDSLAAHLLGLMLLVFSALVLAPMIFVSSGSHVAWGSNAYNLTAVGATWIVAAWLAGGGLLTRSR